MSRQKVRVLEDEAWRLYDRHIDATDLSGAYKVLELIERIQKRSEAVKPAMNGRQQPAAQDTSLAEARNAVNGGRK